MKVEKEKKAPPFSLMLVITFFVFLAISIGIVYIFHWPWFIASFPQLWSIIIGIILLAVGFAIMYNASVNLKVERAFGKEVYKSRTESTLITTGIYGYTRNPIYLSVLILFLGWFFVFVLSFLLIMFFLYLILFHFVGKWEEGELMERIGPEYDQYQKSVPFIIPIPGKRFVNTKDKGK